MIETWGFFSFSPQCDVRQPDDVTVSQYQSTYDKYLELWSNCEHWGFDGLAWAEHHFHLLGMAPSPHLIIASVAARTTRLRFTVAGSVLSLHDGRRHAEECGMLTYLTNGRFEPGIAPGAGPTEAVLAGVPADQIRGRYYSAAEVLAKALAGPRITHHDEFHNYDDLAIVPRPHLEAGQAPWVTVMSPDSAAWCAERGYRLVTGWLPTPAAAALADRYREAADGAGIAPDPSKLAVRRRVFVADTDAEALEKYEAATDLILKFGGKFSKQATATFEMADPKVLKLVSEPDDIIVGSPETVAERLIAQCRAGGYGVLMAFTDWMLHDDFRTMARSQELIGTRVAPQLRRADLGRALSGARRGAAPQTVPG